jgi:hypothetical protein
MGGHRAGIQVACVRADDGGGFAGDVLYRCILQEPVDLSAQDDRVIRVPTAGDDRFSDRAFHGRSSLSEAETCSSRNTGESRRPVRGSHQKETVENMTINSNRYSYLLGE